MELLKFYATWCGPCKQQTKEFEENPVDVEVQSINIDEDTELPNSYNIRSIPTLILLGNGGEIVNRWTGITKSEVINEYIKQYLNGGATPGEQPNA